MARAKKHLPPDMLERLEHMAAAGLSIQQMGFLLGMSKATIERRIAENRQAIEAVEKGRAKALFNVGKSAYEQAISGKNTAMTIFYLKCRGGWKETQEVQLIGADVERSTRVYSTEWGGTGEPTEPKKASG